MVLDVGCSDGRFAKQLVKHPIQYYGFDVMEERIKQAKIFFISLPNFHFKHVNLRNSFYANDNKGDAANFSFPYLDGVFDNVLCSSLFTHLGTEEIATNYMNNIKRVMKSGGLLYITFFTNPPNKIDQYDVTADNRTVYSMEFIDELTDGFSILHIEGGKTTFFNDQLKMIMRCQ